MDLVLFIFVVAIMLVRPTDFIPALEGVQLYLIAISSCIFVSFPRLVAVMSPSELVKLPAGVFMLGILGVSIVSNLGNGNIDGGVEFVADYSKIILLFFLLVGVVDTPSRLRTLIKSLVLITLIPISLAILHFNGVVEVPAYTVTIEQGAFNFNTGEHDPVRRLGASGSFGDPNDITEIINVSLMFMLVMLLDRRGGSIRYAWIFLLPIFLYALTLTKSRGGLLGLIAGLSVLMLVKLGGRRALFLAVLSVPLLLAFVGGRQAAISTSEGTGQARIQLWDAAFEQLKRSPVIGVGTHQLKELISQVAHNSWIQAVAELGLFGGILYFGIYYYLAAALVSSRKEDQRRDPQLAPLRTCLLAGLGSYTVNEMSLTHPFAVFTYVMVGLASAWIRIADREISVDGARVSGNLLKRACFWGAAFYFALYMFTKHSVRYG